MSWDDVCGVCGNDQFWWTSKSGYKVCMRCCPDPYSALEVLARRGKPGLVKVVQGWNLQDAGADGKAILEVE
jgi:hypothetical protein